jgi:hypothetical protein
LGNVAKKEQTKPRGHQWTTAAIGALLVVAAAVAAYCPALHAGYIWDDDSYVTNNTALRTLDGLGRIWLDPSATPQYYPLVHTTFWIEYHLWQLCPLGYHLDNILLHALGAILLWLVLRRLSVPGASRSSTRGEQSTPASLPSISFRRLRSRGPDRPAHARGSEQHGLRALQDGPSR